MEKDNIEAKALAQEPTGEVVAEPTRGDNSETEVTPKARGMEVLRERVRAMYPDEEFADDDAMAERLGRALDMHDEELKGYKSREEELNTMLLKDPRSAQFLVDMRNGVDPVVNFIELFGDEVREALDDPAKKEALAEANKRYLERISRERGLEEEYERNMGETLKTLDSFQEREGLSDEEVEAIADIIAQIAGDFLVGKMSLETLELARKAKGYDKAVKEAGELGEVRGRNQKIQERLRKAEEGDGIAVPSGNGVSLGSDYPELGALGRSAGRKSIWELGGEKRTKYNK